MWFVLGLVSLAVALAWQIRWRWGQAWEGSPSWYGAGVPHHIRWLGGDDRTTGLQVGVQVPDFFRFELKRESWVDRFFKWVGLSVEKQFGHDGFDRLVYVASDDEHLFNRVADSAPLRLAALRLFVEARDGCRVKRVFCANGWLVAEIRRGNFFSGKDDMARLNRNSRVLLPFLEEVAKALRSSAPPGLPPDRRDPFLWPAAVLVATSTALAVNGMVLSMRPLLLDDTFLLDRARLFELTLWVGSAIFIPLMLAHFIFLARSARGHLVLLELLLVGSFGAYSTAALELREANMEWDTSAATVREAAVVSKSISRSRKGGTRHYLHVQDWDGGFDTRSVQVSRSFYESTEKGRVLIFEERRGRFDAAWARLVGRKIP